MPSKKSPQTFEFPRPEKKIVVLEKHGDKREDPYFWLRERENLKVIDYLKAENKVTEALLKTQEKTFENLYKELKSRTAEDDSSVPVKKDNFEYWAKVEKGQEYRIFVRRLHNQPKTDEVILDENKLAKGHDFYQTTGPRMSPNHEIMAYGADTQGRRFFTFEFKNLKTGKMLPNKIENITSAFAWAADNETVFYVKQDPKTLRAYQLYRHHLPTNKTELVYEEKDEEYSLDLETSLSRKFIFLTVGHLQSSEIRYLPTDKPQDKFKVFRKRQKGVQDHLVDGGDRFYLITNEKAKNFKIYSVPYSKVKSPEAWKLIQPHSKDIYISGAEAIQDHLIIQERIEGLDQIKVIETKTGKSRYLKFRDKAYVAEIEISGDFDQTAFRISYMSMRVPEQVIAVDLKTLQQTVLKESPVPNFSSDNYKTERFMVKARDGKRIPVSLVMSKNYEPKGKNPLYVYGYGSYGMSMKPWFSLVPLSLADRGFVYAVAHIRGGSELGRDWYDSGRMKNKMNTFTDFIDVTESLLKKGYGEKGHVYAEGGSAGGLLMGAVANMRPDLYNGIVAEVPFVDVITTMFDDSIPLTTFEYEEWGNPNIKQQYRWMRAYSPYDNVKSQAYPNMLVRTGLHDSQVQYWEPAKWVAKLRDHNTGKNPIFLHVNMDAGHGGASGRYKRLKEEAEIMTFILWLESLN